MGKPASSVSPKRSAEIKNMLSEYLERVLADNLKARRLMSDGNYISVFPREGEEELSVQQWYMDHPIALQETVAAGKGLRSRFFGFFGGRK